MIVGVETTTMGDKITGTNRYLSCLLEQLENTANQIIKFNFSNTQFNRNSFADRIRKNWYRNYSLRNDIVNSETDCVIFPDYYMPGRIKNTSAIIIHDLSFISHPQFYSKYFAVYYKFQLKKTLRQDPLIVTVSEHSKKNIIKYLDVKENDIIIVQGYSNLAYERPPKTVLKNNSQPYLLYVGHIEPRKNLNFLIEGFLKWKAKTKSEFRLKIIGEFWIQSPSTHALMKNYKNHPDIDFAGYVSESELKEAYSCASGFLHTSFEEGFGFPVLEAMHYNLPIICSKGIATEEISQPDSVTIDPDSAESYFNGLEKLAEIIYTNHHIEYDIKYSPQLMLRQLNILLDKLEAKNKNIISYSIPVAANKEEAFEKTLLYASLFNSGINEHKIHQQIFDLKITKDELNTLINKYLMLGKVVRDGSIVSLNNNEKGFYKRKEKSFDKRKTDMLLRFLNRLPFVASIAFSGGTANYGLLNHDDIDLFIITKPYSTYVVYLIIHIYSLLTGTRKELCANYLIDETNLRVTHSRDLYTAHQIISLIAFKNPEKINQFFSENIWIKQFFPNFEIPPSYTMKSNKINYILRAVNKIIFIFYRQLYKKKLQNRSTKDSVIIEENCLKLHTNDHRIKILKEFETKLSRFYENKINYMDLSGKQKQRKNVS